MVDVSVSQSVSLLINISFHECAYSVACECQNICGDLTETTVFNSYTNMKHE